MRPWRSPHTVDSVVEWKVSPPAPPVRPSGPSSPSLAVTQRLNHRTVKLCSSSKHGTRVRVLRSALDYPKTALYVTVSFARGTVSVKPLPHFEYFVVPWPADVVIVCEIGSLFAPDEMSSTFFVADAAPAAVVHES